MVSVCLFKNLQHYYLQYCVKSSRSVQEVSENQNLTAYDKACFLTVATFKTIYEGFFKRWSVTNTANFFHSSSNWGKQRKTERGRGGEEVNVKEEDRERAVNCINLCILIHILATSLISVSPAPFQISLHLTGRYSAWSWQASNFPLSLDVRWSGGTISLKSH